MSNTKTETLPLMLGLDAATKAIEKLRSEASEFGVADCSHLAQAALEAAGVAKLLNEMETLRASIIDFQPEAVLARESALMDRAEKAEARIAELEARYNEARNRLRWIKDGSGIDGFYGVTDDRYDLSLAVARERGHDEPTEDDEFDGWRRLIDLAMKCAERSGGE